MTNIKSVTRIMLVAMILVLAFGTLSFAQGQRYKSGNAWSFGVMGDTQWTNATDPEGKNPQYVSAAIAGALESRFISHGVKFVVQAGDLSDQAGNDAPAARAAAAQPLFDAGIGFFPLRGNHETYGYIFGRDPDYNLNVPAYKAAFPQTQGQGTNLFGATNFSWPSSTSDILKGLSYAFDYNNASFVAVDVEQTSVKHQGIPASQTLTIKKLDGTTDTMDITVGQGYYYVLSSLGNYDTGFTVFTYSSDLNGYTTDYNPDGSTGAAHPVLITAGTWFRVDSSKRASTNFYGWDVENATQVYPPGSTTHFDIWDPPANAANRILEKNSSANTEFWPGKQQSWINTRLDKASRGTEHAFVFSHRGIIAENHTDSFFGTDPSVTPADQNAFFASMANNGVKYMISAHDHLYNRALITSPDGLSQVMQQISMGASTKFYTPAALSGFSGTKTREIQIAQELKNIGYYVYTVDGPRVTVDYYSDATGNFLDDANYPYGDFSVPARLYMPQFNFVKKDTWGYSQNGKQFQVKQGDSYTQVKDSFGKTTAKILAGTNKSTAKDNQPDAPRSLTKAVNTGWTAKPTPLFSDILSLWGMADFDTEKTDGYALSMKYTFVNGAEFMKASSDILKGKAGIAALDKNGNWVNAVDLNVGSSYKKFVYGPYQSYYALGTYGLNYQTGEVWAVINYNADFALADFAVKP
jgi:hypothetical protein